MKKEKMALDVVNPQAAGIDVGSRSHYVAIGQRDEDVKEFGVYNEDLMALAQWLLDNQVKTVAMESTGTYWQSLFTTLQSVGLEVILCNGKFTKNIKGKKTDVKDCQWIQKLHTLGLLSGSFLQMKRPNNSEPIADTELICLSKPLILHAKCKSIYDCSISD